MKCRGLILFIFCLIILPVHAMATTYNISQDGTGDYTSIQEALSVAVSGDELQLAPGVWLEPTLVIYRNLVITGLLGADETILDGGHANRGIHVTAGVTVEFSGLTIRNCLGYDGAGIHVDSGSTATLRDCQLIDNVSTYTGGAGFVRHTGSRLIFENCRFENNYAPKNAGAVGVSLQSYCGFFNCWFENNTSQEMAGAIANYAQSLMEIRGCVFTNNSGGQGGAIRIWGSPATIENNTFFANQSGFGSIFCSSGSTVVIHNNIIAKEQSNYGIYSNASLDLGCNIFFRNMLGPIQGSGLSGSDRIINPGLCDPYGKDFSLCSGSPALPGFSGCELIGALGEGCEECILDIEVDIDIEPKSDDNIIDCLKTKGLIQVAILTTPTFDAASVDHASVLFGPGEAIEAHEPPWTLPS